MNTSRYVGNCKDGKVYKILREKRFCEKKQNLRCEYIIEELECTKSEYLQLNNIKYELNSCRIDCILNKIKYIKVSGYIKDEYDRGKGGVMVSLLKQVICNSELMYINKGDAISDAIGYFQFVVYRDYDIDDYLVKISDGDILI